MAKYVVKLTDGTMAVVEGEKYAVNWDAETHTKGPLQITDESGEEVMFMTPEGYAGVWRKESVRFRGTRKRKQAKTEEIDLGNNE